MLVAGSLQSVHLNESKDVCSSELSPCALHHGLQHGSVTEQEGVILPSAVGGQEQEGQRMVKGRGEELCTHML